jgi:hypothetical protein
MGDFLKGFGVGFANFVGGLVGLGQTDPLEEQRQNLANIKDQTQRLVANSTIAALRLDTQVSRDLLDLIDSHQDRMKDFTDVSNELLWESVARQNLFIVIFFVLLVIVIFFNLFF